MSWTPLDRAGRRAIGWRSRHPLCVPDSLPAHGVEILLHFCPSNWSYLTWCGETTRLRVLLDPVLCTLWVDAAITQRWDVLHYARCVHRPPESLARLVKARRWQGFPHPSLRLLIDPIRCEPTAADGGGSDQPDAADSVDHQGARACAVACAEAVLQNTGSDP